MTKMQDHTLLELISTETDQPLHRQGPLTLRGISVDHLTLDDATPYEFELTGDKHYLAVHDMVFESGEMMVDGGEPIMGGDLRGKLTYIPPRCPIKGWAAPVERTNSFTALYFSPDIMSSELEAKFESAEPSACVYFNDTLLKGTLEKLGRVVTEGAASNSLYAETLGLTAALEFLNFWQLAGKTVPTLKGQLSASASKLVSDYIEDRYASDITLDELASLAGLSRFHFLRAFKATFGKPPHRYLMDRRLAAARRLLVTTTLPLQEIANITGLGSGAEFSRSFKAANGFTPAAFRKAAA